MFATEALRIDVTAMLIMVVLMLTGLVSPEEGISGFSNPATITVMAMLMLSLGLQNTGFVNILGNKLGAYTGKKEWQTILVLMIVVGIMSAFINNTAAVAVFIPVVLSVAKKNKLSPSKLLMPISFAAILGGSITLIGTSTNLLVSSIAQTHGLKAFSMFEFASFGLMFLLTGILYMVFIGRKIIPARRKVETLTEGFDLREYLTEVVILEDSGLVNKKIKESKLGDNLDIDVLEITRADGAIWFPNNVEKLHANDVLLIRGSVADIASLQKKEGVAIKGNVNVDDTQLMEGDKVLTEAVITTESFLIGKTLKSASFRQRYGAVCLAIRRDGVSLNKRISKVEFKLGDSLLIECHKNQVNNFRNHPDFLLLKEINSAQFNSTKVVLAVAIVATVVALAAFNVLPILISSLAGVVALIITKCITIRRIYQQMEWQVVFLLAGMIPLGVALENSGADVYIANFFTTYGAQYPPFVMIGTLYLITALLTEILSNNASAILIAPIAITTANILGYDPRAFLLTIMFAASFSFLTPIGYQTNALVYGPGKYKYTDYTKTGIALSISLWILTTIFITLYWIK
jgi:di/tricarboxylate transporter